MVPMYVRCNSELSRSIFGVVNGHGVCQML